MEEVGNARIVAIAVHDFAPEMSGVVAQLVLDVGKLRVELVVPLSANIVETSTTLGISVGRWR